MPSTPFRSTSQPPAQRVGIRASVYPQETIQYSTISGPSATLHRQVYSDHPSREHTNMIIHQDLENPRPSGIMQAQGTPNSAPSGTMSYPGSQVNPGTSAHTGQHINPSSALNVPAMQQVSDKIKLLPPEFSCKAVTPAFPSLSAQMATPQAPVLAPSVMNYHADGQGGNQFLVGSSNNSVQLPTAMQAQDISRVRQGNEFIQDFPQQVNTNPEGLAISNKTLLTNANGQGAQMNGVTIPSYPTARTNVQAMATIKPRNSSLPVTLLCGGAPVQNTSTGPSGHIAVQQQFQNSCNPTQGGTQNLVAPSQELTRNPAPNIQQAQQVGLLTHQNIAFQGIAGNHLVGIAPNGQQFLVTPLNQPQTNMQRLDVPTNTVIGAQQQRLDMMMQNGMLNVAQKDQSFNTMNQQSQIVNPCQGVNNLQLSSQGLKLQPIPQANLKLAFAPSTSPSTSTNINSNGLMPVQDCLNQTPPTLSSAEMRNAPTKSLNESQGTSIQIPDQDISDFLEHPSALGDPNTQRNESKSTVPNAPTVQPESSAFPFPLFRGSFEDLDAAPTSNLHRRGPGDNISHQADEGLKSVPIQETEDSQPTSDVTTPNSKAILDKQSEGNEITEPPPDANRLERMIQEVSVALDVPLDCVLQSNRPELNPSDDNPTEPEIERNENETDHNRPERDNMVESDSVANNPPSGPESMSLENGTRAQRRLARDSRKLGPGNKPAVDQEAWEAYLNYDWTKMSPAQRRKRRAYICNCKRLAVAERKIVKTVRRGEQPIEFRTLNDDEIRELSKRYPKMTGHALRDKKVRNRVVAQESRNQRRGNLEFLEKENEKLRNQNAFLLSQHARILAVEAENARKQGDSFLKQQLQKLQILIRSQKGRQKERPEKVADEERESP